MRKMRLALVSIFAISSFSLFIFFTGGSVSALDGSLDNYGPPQNSSTGVGSRSWFAVGNGACPTAPDTCTDGFDGYSMAVNLYSKSQVMTVRLVNPGGGCATVDNNSDSNLTYFIFHNSDGALLDVRGYSNNGSQCGTYDLNLSSSSATQYYGGYYRIQATIVLNGYTPYVENSFRINIISNTANSYVSVPNSTINNNSRAHEMTGIYQKDNPTGSYWNTSIVFAPECGGPQTRLAKLRWFDADFNQYGQNDPAHQLTMTLQRKLRNNSGTWAQVDTWTGATAIGNSGLIPSSSSLREREYTFNKDYKYRWIWTNVSQINTIQVGLPFDQMNTLETNCNQPDPGLSFCNATANPSSLANGGTVRINVTVNNYSGQTWNTNSSPNFWIRQTIDAPPGAPAQNQNLDRRLNGTALGWSPPANMNPTGPTSLTSGANGTISFNISRSSPTGQWSFNYRMYLNGNPVGEVCSAIFTLGGTPNATCVGINYSYAGQPVDGRNWPWGQTVDATIRVRNNGNVPWSNSNFKLGEANYGNSSHDTGNFMVGARAYLASSINPGQEVEFGFQIPAKNTGQYTFAYQMLEEGVGWFGENLCPTTISVYDNGNGLAASCQSISGQVYMNDGVATYGRLLFSNGYATPAFQMNGVSGGFKIDPFKANFDSTPDGNRADGNPAPSGVGTQLLPHSSYSAVLQIEIAPGVFSNAFSRTGNVITSGPFGNCLTISCDSAAEYEFGSATPYRLSYRVNNQSYANIGGYSVGLTGPPNGPGGTTSNNPALNPNGDTNFWLDYEPQSNGNVVGTLLYGGSSTGLSSSPSCRFNVLRYPYIKAYGAEVMAGGGFGSTCSTRSGIFAMMRPMGQQVSTNKSGSGSQLGAFAFSQDGSSRISGFASAILRTSAPNATRGNALHFGGVNYDLNSRTPAMGGNLTGNPICMPDYFNDTQYPESNTTVRRQGDSTIQQTGLSNNYNGKQVFYEGNATVNYGGASTHQGRTTYYVEGNVQINSNVRYDGNYANVADIPNFTLIVKGNIYIAPNVTQLDGIYIAQPQEGNESTTGQIFTCARNYTAYTSASAVYTNCSGGYGGPYNTQSLRVNGSFIAQRIILNRAVNTLNNSTFREPQASSQAAEIFNYSPEIILSPPVFRPTGGPTGSSYESIGVLPPLL